MYAYFDESVRTINGKKYVTLGCILFDTKPKINLILREFSKTRSNIKYKDEIKYSNVMSVSMRDRILNKIKDSSLGFYFSNKELIKNKDIHKVITDSICEILKNIENEFELEDLVIIYDKSTYTIDNVKIKKIFSFIKEDVMMLGSKKSIGIQYADWIAGEASAILKQKNQR